MASDRRFFIVAVAEAWNHGDCMALGNHKATSARPTCIVSVVIWNIFRRQAHVVMIPKSDMEILCMDGEDAMFPGHGAGEKQFICQVYAITSHSHSDRLPLCTKGEGEASNPCNKVQVTCSASGNRRIITPFHSQQPGMTMTWIDSFKTRLVQFVARLSLVRRRQARMIDTSAADPTTLLASFVFKRSSLISTHPSRLNTLAVRPTHRRRLEPSVSHGSWIL